MIKQLQHPFLLLWVRVVLARPQLQVRFSENYKVISHTTRKNDWMKWMVWITILKQKQVFKP